MAQLLDQYGRPVKRKELVQELARPGMTGIRQVWTPDVAAGLTPSRLAAILTAAAEGEGHDYLALAEQIEERDPHYASVLGTRKRAVSGIEPVVKPASEDAKDKKIADAVREKIAEHDDFPDLVEDLLDGIGKGYSVVEIIWETSAAAWTPARFEHRDPRFFRFDRETLKELRLLTEEHPAEGEPLAPYKFITHIPRLKTGLPLRGGLARLAAFTWICKAYTVKDWVAFAEIFGLPLRLGRYDAAATKKDVEALYTAVASIGSDAAAVLPKAMEIEFQEIGSGQGVEIFERLAVWADKQLSKAVLGQTMTADDGSSRAQAGVHNEVRLDIMKADARQLNGAINRDLVRPFVDLNFGRQADYPRVLLPVDEPADVDKTILGVQRLARLGVKFSASELRDRLGLRAPEDDDDTVGFSAKELLEQIGVRPDTAANHAAALNAALDPYAETDDIEGGDLDHWEEIMDPVIDPVRRLLAEAGSYEEALARLPELYGEMAPEELLDRLVQAAAKARGEGGAAG